MSGFYPQDAGAHGGIAGDDIAAFFHGSKVRGTSPKKEVNADADIGREPCFAGVRGILGITEYGPEAVLPFFLLLLAPVKLHGRAVLAGDYFGNLTGTTRDTPIEDDGALVILLHPSEKAGFELLPDGFHMGCHDH